MFLFAFSSVLAVLCTLGVFGVGEEYHEVAIPYIAGAGIVYFLLDFYDCKLAYRIHHGATIVIFGCIIYDPSTELATSVIRMVSNMEISTLFLNACILLPNNKLLQCLFLVTFFYIRIYLFYWFFPEHFHIMDDLYHAYFASLMVLFVVQLYWGGLLLKKIVRDSFQGEKYVKICHAITSSSYVLAIYADYVSGGATIASLTMHGLVAATSFMYYINPDSENCFIADSIAIHLIMSYRSWRFQPNGIEVQVLFSLMILYYRTQSVRANKDAIAEMCILSSFVTMYDYIIMVFNTPNGLASPLIWEYSVQILLMYMSQYMNWFNDLSYIFFHIGLIANANTFGRIFLSAGV